MTSQTALEYFRFIANLGYTKHPGSVAATRKLVQGCHIDRDSLVLDVGCGVGATPVFLAQTAGCRVVGVDLLEEMVAQSRARAREAGVADRVEFRVADARSLPFEEGQFDAVLSESVLAFLDDRPAAMAECARVTRSGGYVGIDEVTWLQPPTPEMREHYKRLAYVEPEEASGWIALMEGAGLVDIVADYGRVDTSAEARGRIERYGCRGNVRAVLSMLRLYLKDPQSRQLLAGAVGGVSKDMFEYWGQGVFVGRKP